MQENPPGDRWLAADWTLMVQQSIVLKREAELAPKWMADHVNALILICHRKRIRHGTRLDPDRRLHKAQQTGVQQFRWRVPYNLTQTMSSCGPVYVGCCLEGHGCLVASEYSPLFRRVAHHVSIGEQKEFVAERFVEIAAADQKSGPDSSTIRLTDQRNRACPVHCPPHPPIRLNAGVSKYLFERCHVRFSCALNLLRRQTEHPGPSTKQGRS